MSLRRHAVQRDGNEAELVRDLRKLGAIVDYVSGKGLPDLLVRYRGSVYAWEIKIKKGKRTHAQDQSRWPIVRSIDEALLAMNVTTKEPTWNARSGTARAR